MIGRTSAAAALLILVPACGRGEPATPAPAAPAQTQAAPPPTETAPAPAPAGGGGNADTSVKPVIAKPSGSPPAELKTEDIVPGKGAAAKKGSAMTVQYVGVAFSTGMQFDASWDRGQPFQFELGAGMVIEGWDKGLVGMKPGGRRQLTIPAEMAYGPEGAPPDIGPNETLIFVIDLLDAG